ncbi:Nucleoside hydrolase [Candidatus Bealeia paramacronuclearis]|uniref:Nucleoside hydrolase n=1 Tax=Candidatus Bealeia paramacronuclearis TaxID=1921001 RepID=A0ABZ2C1R6_9PROT|nr:Nucleoside hydrolase [Candidatus Bealeia paramacronuclearis]
MADNLNPRSLIIDCDPGVDDFVALMMAFARPEQLNVLGVTTVAGNVAPEFTQTNARRACEIAGRMDVPVFAGCPRPMLKKLKTEEVVHGICGLGGADLPSPTMPLQKTHAVDFIIDTLMSTKAPITMATTGPMTNLATAIVKEPRILHNIDEIVSMGGAMTLGNITPAAEYNFFCDPHAARIVFSSGKKIKLMSLDLTHNVVTSRDWLECIHDLGNPVSRAVYQMLSFFHVYDTEHFGTSGGVLHDPCVIGYLLAPKLFQGKDVHVEIDTTDGITGGRSIIDFWDRRGLEINAHVFDKVDVHGFFTLLTTLIESYGKTKKLQQAS